MSWESIDKNSARCCSKAFLASSARCRSAIWARNSALIVSSSAVRSLTRVSSSACASRRASSACLRRLMSRSTQYRPATLPAGLRTVATRSDASKGSPPSGSVRRGCRHASHSSTPLLFCNCLSRARKLARSALAMKRRSGLPTRKLCERCNRAAAVWLASRMIPAASVMRYPSGAKLNSS